MRTRKDRAHRLDLRATVRVPGHAAGGVAGADAELGEIFHNMRVAMKVSRGTIARRLATAVTTVDTFEAGAVAAFPRWPGTERIVRAYCALLRLDPEPILRRIHGRLHALAQPRPARVAPRIAMRAAAAVDASPVARRRRPGAGRGLARFGIPLTLAAVLLGVTQIAPAALYRGIALLPEALAGPAHRGLDQLLLLTAARREGLRWVDVGDPRVRKAGRLPPPAH